MSIYKPYIASVLSFVMQLERDTDELLETYEKVLRLLAPGPGNWITPNDLENLQRYFSFPLSYVSPQCTSKAAKLRIAATIATDCAKRANELDRLRLEKGRSHFSDWHDRCYLAVLAKNMQDLRRHGVTRSSVRRHMIDSNINSFQRAAEQLIFKHARGQYYPESRIRQKLSRWHLRGIPGILERRVLRALEVLAQWCPPRVLVVYL
eukprot:4677120-Karenia_brevis.AAC.1